jgi:hypothetical protein
VHCSRYISLSIYTIDDTLICNYSLVMDHDNVMIVLGMKSQKHREANAPNKVMDEMCTATGAKRTKTFMEENGWRPDLQLSLSPNEGAEAEKAKKRKVVLSSEQEVGSVKMSPLSLSLSLRGGDSGGDGDAGRLEAEIGSSSKKAAPGLSTLDMTMSMKALE